MAVARGEAGFLHLRAILVLGRLGTGWNQKTIQKKSSRSNSVVLLVTHKTVRRNQNDLDIKCNKMLLLLIEYRVITLQLSSWNCGRSGFS